MKPSIEQLIQRVKKTEHGFTDIKRAAEEVALRTSDKEAIQAAKQLFTSDVHQARMLATFIFGMHAAQSKQCLNFLRTRVSNDVDWRVQEILAQAFDRFCADLGYDKAVPAIKQWLGDTNPNVRVCRKRLA